MKKQLLLLAMILLPLVASAHDIEVKNADGVTIYYDYINNGTELKVTYRGSSYNDYSIEYQDNVVIPEEVTYMNRTLKVTSIGDGAFRNCYGLTSVTIPNSVTSIGGGAFLDCSGLTSVTIPNSVMSIGSNAFAKCFDLKKVIVKDIAAWCGIKFDGSYSNPLYYAKHIYSDEDTEITNLIIPNSVTSIGNYAFYNCSGLTSVTIGNSVTSIGDYAFYGCSGLTSITIPNGVTSIGDYAFYNCSGLTSITIGNSVTSIGERAFYDCYKLTSVTIPNSVTSIGDDAFYDCSGLKKVIVKDIAAWCGIKFGGSYSNPLYYAKHIYSDEDTEITNQIIPNSVTSIGNYAFYNCSGLTSVTIPNSVTSIGGSAFEYCSGLTSITIGNSVTSIGERAFYDCYKLTSVTIPNSVTSIGGNAFANCYGLKKVIVKDIAVWCGIKFGGPSSNPLFYAKHIYSDEDTEITNLIIPNSVTSIGNYAFYNCSGLTSVTIPNSVTSIEIAAFSGCTGLTSVTIPNSVTSIGDSAFAYCFGLTSITIPNSVTSIGDGAFYYCSGLTSVTIPNSVTSIRGSAFAYCFGLTSITIPNSVTSIGNYAFSECYGLTSVTIGSGVTSIGRSAFDRADISTVISLIENPFKIKGKTSSVSTFSQNTFLNATLYVPKGTIEKYKATDGWKDFVFIEEGNGSGGDTPTTQKCEKPTISYENGKLTFTSETEGAVCQYSITDTDIKAGSGNEVQLGVTYNISVFAAKAGYENSETATATLCWIDQQPKTEGITNGIANIPANAVLIQSEGGSIKVQGVDEGTQVNVYSVNGTQAGSAISQSGAATINTNLQPGSIAIIKIGQKSVKVAIK